MKLIFSFVFALILGSRAFGAEGKYEEFFASVTSHFYMFQMSARELSAALNIETDPKTRSLFETLIKIKNARAHSNDDYRKFATSLVDFYELRSFQSPEFQRLNDLELLSIRWYTGDDYQTINSALRSGSALNLAGYISVLDRALEKLPEYRGYTTRGTNLPDTVGDTYKIGNIVSDPAYFSTSILIQYPGRYQLKILSKSGRLVDPISQNKGEGEVLFPRGTRFKVLKRENHQEHINIELEEISPTSIKRDE